jgi:hypothetical protein
MEVGNDKVTQAAVSRLVRKEQSCIIMHAEIGGKKMDETVAAMVESGTMLHISKLIEDHNSESDFHLDMHTIMSRHTSGDPGMTFTSKLKVWLSAGNRMPFHQLVCRGIIMPSMYLITNLESKGFDTMEKLCNAVDPIRQQYQSMMVNMEEFMI